MAAADKEQDEEDACDAFWVGEKCVESRIACSCFRLVRIDEEGSADEDDEVEVEASRLEEAKERTCCARRGMTAVELEDAIDEQALQYFV